MTPVVHCARCGLLRPGLGTPPFRPGSPLEALGATLQARVCAACYRDWLEMSVKLVNETRLDLTSPAGRLTWTAQMSLFLNLDPVGDPWARRLNQRVLVETVTGTVATATLIGLDDSTLRLADFAGETIPPDFAPLDTRGAATIARDAVRSLEGAP